ncbi:transglycosylase domain-containing protein [Thermoactinospora rubra]|uniref:transglycosylase domain-containing protein n=1 Tax=Thermoactinospora rubra TaxID=1088767 RepID=UPI000A10A5FD|nr:transglycosylase domain-containing protein [Thermoactinospora rubra]
MAGMVILAAGLFGMMAVAYANIDVPTATQADAQAQASTIYYADGKTEIAKIGKRRTIVPLDKMNPVLRDAVIAIENDTFYEDEGISVPGMVRSVWMTVTGQQLQGASTITQQMVRNYYDGLSQEVSIQRKIKEIFVAMKVDNELTKDKILETYLNTVNFGAAWGVEEAAQAYFGKSAAKVTPAEAAYLAARIQQPAWSEEDPALKHRFGDVLRRMATVFPDKYGNIAATATFPKVRKANDKDYSLKGRDGYMVSEVLRELKAKGITREEVETSGYKIVSTFDRRLMKLARDAVVNRMRSMSAEFHAGLAVVDPKNGRVVAFYGGEDYLTDPWNEPFDSKKQAASAFKSYVLAAWLNAGYSLDSYVPGNKTVPAVLPGQQKGGIRNSHNVGPAVNLITATAESVNTAFVSMAYRLDQEAIGDKPENHPGKQLQVVKELAEAAGLDKERLEKDIHEHHYQFAIGSALVSPVEQAAGYAIFANKGLYHPAHVVKEVIGKHPETGKPMKVLVEDKTPKRVISEQAAADATVALSEVLKSGTAAGKGIGRPAAGKTGTNNDEKEAWFVGYTPQYVAAVGMYREQCRTAKGKVVQPRYAHCPWSRYKDTSKETKYTPQKPYSEAYEVSLGFEGAGPPTEIWRAFMMAAHQGKPVEQFPPRANVGVAENIVPKPQPKPDPVEEDPFGDNPDNQGDCILGICGDDDGDATIDTGIPDDQGDPFGDGSQGNGDGNGWGQDNGNGNGPPGGGPSVSDPLGATTPTREDE